MVLSIPYIMFWTPHRQHIHHPQKTNNFTSPFQKNTPQVTKKRYHIIRRRPRCFTSPRNLQQDPRFTDPEKTWVSHSSIGSNFLKGVAIGIPSHSILGWYIWSTCWNKKHSDTAESRLGAKTKRPAMTVGFPNSRNFHLGFAAKNFFGRDVENQNPAGRRLKKIEQCIFLTTVWQNYGQNIIGEIITAILY